MLMTVCVHIAYCENRSDACVLATALLAVKRWLPRLSSAGFQA